MSVRSFGWEFYFPLCINWILITSGWNDIGQLSYLLAGVSTTLSLIWGSRRVRKCSSPGRHRPQWAMPSPRKAAASSLILFLLPLLLEPVLSMTGNKHAARLFEDLLGDYNKLVRPVDINSQTLVVKFKLKLSQLLDVVSSALLLILLPKGTWCSSVFRWSKVCRLLFFMITISAREKSDHDNECLASAREFLFSSIWPWVIDCPFPLWQLTSLLITQNNEED